MPSGEKIRDGDYVLLYSDRKKWLTRVEPRQFHTHKGIIDLESVVGKRYGERVKSTLNYDFVLLKPLIVDYISNIPRFTQIIYPKDIGLIIQHLDISPGKVVLEIGTGSGALSLSIANLVKPEGHLYTYESKKRFAEMAKRNIRRAGLGDYVTIINKDAKSGIEVGAVDAVSIDVGDPWEIIPVVSDPLKLGSPLCSFSPTVNQVEKTVESLRSLGFVDISTLECFVRHMRVEAGKTRPATTMISHTGYLTFARRGEMP